MNYIKDQLRRERQEMNVTILLVAILSGVSGSAISLAERGLLQLSPAATRAILATMTSLQHLRMHRPELRLAACEVDWLRREIAKMNDDKDAVAIKAAGEASNSARTKRIRPTSGKPRHASAK